MSVGLFFSLTKKKDKEKIAKVGDVVLTRTVFTITQITSEEDKVVQIIAPEEVPQLPEGEYITIRDASKKFKISGRILRKWSRENKIRSIKKSNRLWLLHREQLEHYIIENYKSAN